VISCGIPATGALGLICWVSPAPSNIGINTASWEPVVNGKRNIGRDTLMRFDEIYSNEIQSDLRFLRLDEGKFIEPRDSDPKPVARVLRSLSFHHVQEV